MRGMAMAAWSAGPAAEEAAQWDLVLALERQVGGAAAWGVDPATAAAADLLRTAREGAATTTVWAGRLAQRLVALAAEAWTARRRNEGLSQQLAWQEQRNAELTAQVAAYQADPLAAQVQGLLAELEAAEAEATRLAAQVAALEEALAAREGWWPDNSCGSIACWRRKRSSRVVG